MCRFRTNHYLAKTHPISFFLITPVIEILFTERLNSYVTDELLRLKNFR